MKISNINKIAIAVTSSFLLFACGGDNKASSKVSTEQIWADFKIESDGKESKVKAELHERDSSGAHLILAGGDYLQVSVLNTKKKLQFDNIFEDAKYQSKVSVTSDNALFTIDFYRKKEGSMLSTAELPQNFKILSPIDNASYGPNNDLLVQIDGVDSESNTEIIMTAKCKATSGGDRRVSQSITFNEVASQQFDLTELTMFQDSAIDRSKSCDLDIEISRSRQGQVASQFTGGSRIRAYQIREVEDITVRLN